MNNWLIDETSSIDQTALEASLREAVVMRGRRPPALAVRINDLVIHDTKKWFGSANIRLDTLIVHGATKGGSKDYFQASTLPFSGIRDGDRLPIEYPGHRVFYGHPAHFLDVSIFVSRDTKDSDELASLVKTELNSEPWKVAAGAVLAATAVAPQAAAIVGAVTAATTLANIVYNLLRNSTGNAIGLYRASWLQYKDRFGIGRHPKANSFHQQDFSFWYEIVLDKKT